MKINPPQNHGWITVDVTPEEEKLAKAVRAQRDQQYGNIYPEAASDMRWVGDLGEMVFDAWLKDERIAHFDWITDDTAGKPDFILPNRSAVGVKTVKRKVRPNTRYTAQITKTHAAEPIDYYFFLSYEFLERRMWLLGGIERERFLREARYYRAGKKVHDNYTVREGHEIYNIVIEKLLTPRPWLVQVLKI